jgi:hypothetical protein
MPAISPSATVRAARWNSRVACAASSGRAAACHSATKVCSARASGASNSSERRSHRSTRRRSQRSYQAAADRHARSTAHRADQHGRVDGQVPQHEPRQREREDVDHPAAVQHGQCKAERERDEQQQATGPRGVLAAAHQRAERRVPRLEPGEQPPRAALEESLETRARVRLRDRLAQPRQLADRRPRGLRAVGGGQQRSVGVGLLDRPDQQHGPQSLLAHRRLTSCRDGRIPTAGRRAGCRPVHRSPGAAGVGAAPQRLGAGSREPPQAAAIFHDCRCGARSRRCDGRWPARPDARSPP